MSISFNGIDKIKDDAGDYVLLVDYGSEGISVYAQFKTLGEAVRAMARSSCGGCQSIVKVVRISGSQEE